MNAQKICEALTQENCLSIALTAGYLSVLQEVCRIDGDWRHTI